MISEESAFAWFQDQIPANAPVVLSKEEISCLRDCLVELTPEEESQLSQFIPDPDSDLQRGNFIRALFQKKKLLVNLLLLKPGWLKPLKAKRFLKWIKKH